MMSTAAAMTPEALKQWIADHEYTHESLAQALGISRSSLHKWITGRHPVMPTAKLALEQLATGQDVAADFILDGADLESWMERFAFDDALLAEVLDVHYLSVRRWRTGVHPISRTLRLALARLEADRRALATRQRLLETQATAKREATERAREAAQKRVDRVRRRAVEQTRR